MVKKRNVAGFRNPFEDEEPEEKTSDVVTQKEYHQQFDDYQIINNFLNQFYKKKETKEDTHTRKTFLIENNLLNEIKQYTSKLGYGFQTKFINEAIRRQLEQLKVDEKLLKGKKHK